MKISKKHALWMLCAGVVLVSLAGCGSSEEQTTGATNAPANVTVSQSGPISNGGSRSIDPRTTPNAAAPQ